MADTLLYDAQFHHFAQVRNVPWLLGNHASAAYLDCHHTLWGPASLIRSRAALLSSLPDPILPQVMHHLQLLAATAITAHMSSH